MTNVHECDRCDRVHVDKSLVRRSRPVGWGWVLDSKICTECVSVVESWIGGEGALVDEAGGASVDAPVPSDSRSAADVLVTPSPSPTFRVRAVATVALTGRTTDEWVSLDDWRMIRDTADRLERAEAQLELFHSMFDNAARIDIEYRVTDHVDGEGASTSDGEGSVDAAAPGGAPDRGATPSPFTNIDRAAAAAQVRGEGASDAHSGVGSPETEPSPSPQPRHQAEGVGCDGPVSGGDTAVCGDGADSHDVGRSGSEPTPAIFTPGTLWTVELTAPASGYALDRDGDLWVRQPDLRWKEPNDLASEARRWSEVAAEWGPMTELHPSTDLRENIAWRY